jgi:hypothetical protein
MKEFSKMDVFGAVKEEVNAGSVTSSDSSSKEDKFKMSDRDVSIALKEYLVNPVDIPENMQIRFDDIITDATVAHYVCYAHSIGTPVDIISARTNLTSSRVESIIEDAISFDLYDDLVNSFLK